MAVYPPPTENLPIFDNEVFLTGDEALTYNEAKKKFLRYPSAQGKETLQAVDVNGVATFKSNIVQDGNDVTITQIDTTPNTNPNTFRRTDIRGDLTVYKPTGAQGGGIRAFDVASDSGNSMQLYQSGLTSNWIGLALNATMNIIATNNVGVGGAQKQVIRANATTGTIIQTDTTDSTTNAQLRVVETTTGKCISLYAHSAASNYNPLVRNDDNAIFANTTTNSSNTQTLTVTTHSATTSGVRITPTTAQIGAGGTTNTPTTSVTCSATAVAIQGPATVTAPVGGIPLSVNIASGYTNDGLVLTNTAIKQTGSQITACTNAFTTSQVIDNATFGISKAAQLIVYGSTNSNQYKFTSNNTSTFNFDHFDSSTGLTVNLINIPQKTNINMALQTRATYTMPAVSDSSTIIPSTAWVQGAIAAGGSSFAPKFVNYTDIQTANSGYSNGPAINFNGTWAINDICYVRVTSQISYTTDGTTGEYLNHASTSGIVYFRPYFMVGGWAPSSPSNVNSVRYAVNVPTTYAGPNGKAYYYNPSFNIGEHTLFYFNGGTATSCRFSCVNPKADNAGLTNGNFEFFVSLEYLGSRTTSGTVTFSDGVDAAGINNTLN
jgi:hypothetical protein